MMPSTLSHNTLVTDDEGYLLSPADWSEAVAQDFAQRHNITLTPAHWEILHLLRRFYHEYQLSPAMRPLVKYIARELGADKGSSIYLLQLFPHSPAKVAAHIAGLPKPDHCL